MVNEPRPGREAAESAAAEWITRRDTVQWDGVAFEAWLNASVSHRVAYYRLNAAWQEAGRLQVLGPGIDFEGLPTVADAASSQDSVSSILTDEHEAAKGFAAASVRAPGSRRRVLAVAASLGLLLVGALTVWNFERAGPNHFSTVIGGLQAVPLADGSRVTLNTDSELQVALAPQLRVVNLNRGEAYFEVAKDKARPFIVNAGSKRVIAVGTQFSVRRDGGNVQVIVTEGTVRMEDRDAASAPGYRAPADRTGAADTVMLPAGSVARAQAGAVLVHQEAPAEIEQHLSWRSGELIFRDTSLSDAVREFNRYNERKMVIEDPSIANLQLGGIFRSTNIDPFIELLEQGFPVRATAEGNRIVLTHN